MTTNSAQVPPKVLPCNGDPTVREAAAETGTHHNTIRKWISEGRIEAYRVGPRVIRIKRESLQNLITPVDS